VWVGGLTAVSVGVYGHGPGGWCASVYAAFSLSGGA